MAFTFALMITLIIIAATVLVSISGFSNQELFYRFKFSPYQVKHSKEWYRIFSHTLLHGDYMHLFFNMFVLYQFGGIVESYFVESYGTFQGNVNYLLLYIGGAAFAALPGLKRHGDNYNYSAIGASGAVAAILFAAILLNPTHIFYVYGTIPLPAVVLGVLYLALEYYLDKRGGSNIAHDAHFWGAVFGFVFPVALNPQLIVIFFAQIFS